MDFVIGPIAFEVERAAGSMITIDSPTEPALSVAELSFPWRDALMTIVALAGLWILAGAFVFLADRKMHRIAKEDRKQRQLALMFLAAGRATTLEAESIADEIKLFLFNEGWGRAEAFDRMAQATSMVKALAPGPPYKNALGVWRRLKEEL
jgi:hypothetical protein